MMYNEFIELAGYEVDVKVYDEIIEPMYMATKLSKEEFIKTLNKKYFALPTAKEILKEMKKIATHLYDICGLYTDYKNEERLQELAKQYAKRVYGLDWTNDIDVYVVFNKGYEFPQLERGCTYPKELVIGKGRYEYGRVTLIKE